MKDLFSLTLPSDHPIAPDDLCRTAGLWQLSLAFLVLIGLTGCAHQLPAPSNSRPYDWNKDRFSFANETVWTYDQTLSAPEKSGAQEKQSEAYTRRCFVMARAALQFRKFARFDPAAPRVSDAELARRVSQVASKPVWEPELAKEKKIVFPGSQDLYTFSRRHSSLLQQELGAGWPTYFRAGNMALPFPISRDHQQRTADEMREMIRNKQPVVLWLTRFPSLAINHSVLAYAVRSKGALLQFDVYDPNYTDSPKKLTYNPADKTFSFEKTFYFKGGPVTVRTVYWSHLQ